MRPTSRINSEDRDRNNSAPNCPTTRMHIAKAAMTNPVHDGRTGSLASLLRSCQMIRAENSGTKNPCEKLGSLLHWVTRRPKMEPYNHRVSRRSNPPCHHGRPSKSRPRGCETAGATCTELPTLGQDMRKLLAAQTLESGTSQLSQPLVLSNAPWPDCSREVGDGNSWKTLSHGGFERIFGFRPNCGQMQASGCIELAA